jgi:hypothetical protein
MLRRSAVLFDSVREKQIGTERRLHAKKLLWLNATQRKLIYDRLNSGWAAPSPTNGTQAASFILPAYAYGNAPCGIMMFLPPALSPTGTPLAPPASKHTPSQGACG